MVIWVIETYLICSSSVYSCHLFLISSASFRSLPLLSFIMTIHAWNVSMISPAFLKRSLIFLTSFYCFPLFHCIVHLRRPSYLSLPFSETLHSVWYIFPIFPCLSLLFFPQQFVKPSQTTILLSCVSFSLEWLWSWPPVQYYGPQSIVLQALCLLDRIS